LENYNENTNSRQFDPVCHSQRICAYGAEEPKGAPDAKAPFTFVVLPDTQNYSSNFPDIFIKQTEWIRDNKDKLNIVAVFHLGDVTNGNSAPEWKTQIRH